VEQRGIGKGKATWLVWPWLVFGSNAILAYMFSEVVPAGLENIVIATGSTHMSLIAWFYVNTWRHIPDPGWAAFGYSLTVCAVCLIPVWILYRKKIFLKV